MEHTNLDTKLRKKSLGQYFTEVTIASFMASFFNLPTERTIRILEPGAGEGVLIEALLKRLCKMKKKDRPVQVEAYVVEVDSNLRWKLENLLSRWKLECRRKGINLVTFISVEDYIDFIQRNEGQIFFDLVVTNPPYIKVNKNSDLGKKLLRAGLYTPNLYASFVLGSIRLLKDGGQVVGITPRSFCNGTYFRTFRWSFLNSMVYKRFHTFSSRSIPFGHDGVLQETVIFHAVKGKSIRRKVLITSSNSQNDKHIKKNSISYKQLVNFMDRDLYINLPLDVEDNQIMSVMHEASTTLKDLCIEVSTGKVVDFRQKEFLKEDFIEGSTLLVHPFNFFDGEVRVLEAESSPKPNYILVNEKTKKYLLPSDYYVLVKRFTSKEAKKRIVAALYDHGKYPHQFVAFENRINFFHQKGMGLPYFLAKGLLVYLNSDFLDKYIRQFSGHTQVNVNDLRHIKYPNNEQLIHLGRNADIIDQNDKIEKMIVEIMKHPQH